MHAFLPTGFILGVLKDAVESRGVRNIQALKETTISALKYGRYETVSIIGDPEIIALKKRFSIPFSYTPDVGRFTNPAPVTASAHWIIGIAHDALCLFLATMKIFGLNHPNIGDNMEELNTSARKSDT
ncbi:MAG TPA: hypothetical protein VKF36_15190 [Syntrophorhabdales bacterium]|nr:hypothetical protein [Syntrophorhabdales bacterium]